VGPRCSEAHVLSSRVVGVAACFAGPVEEGEKVLRPLKAFGSPVLDLADGARTETRLELKLHGWPPW
jgi:hypothetical protein